MLIPLSLILSLPLLLPQAAAFDSLFNTGNDRFEKQFSALDSVLNPSPSHSPAKAQANKNLKNEFQKYALFEKLNRQVRYVRKRMNSEDIHSIKSRFLWEEIYKYIMANLPKFLKDLKFSITINMTYSFCFFVVPLNPTNYFLLIPNFYRLLIPVTVRSVPIVREFIELFSSFLKRVKKRTDEEFIAAITISRTLGTREDLEFIRKIPDLLERDPLQLVKWLMDFNVSIVGERTG